MHGIFQALAAVWLRSLPYFCVTSSKTEGSPGGIILRNTPPGFEVYLFRYGFNDKVQMRTVSQTLGAVSIPDLYLNTNPSIKKANPFCCIW